MWQRIGFCYLTANNLLSLYVKKVQYHMRISDLTIGTVRSGAGAFVFMFRTLARVLITAAALTYSAQLLCRESGSKHNTIMSLADVPPQPETNCTCAISHACVQCVRYLLLKNYEGNFVLCCCLVGCFCFVLFFYYTSFINAYIYIKQSCTI